MFYKIFRHIIFRKFFVYLNMSNSGFFSYGRERCKRRRFVVLVNPCIVSKISDMDTEYVRDLYISGYRSSYTVFELKQTPSETTWDPFNFIALSNISQNYFATNKLVFMQYFAKIKPNNHNHIELVIANAMHSVGLSEWFQTGLTEG